MTRAAMLGAAPQFPRRSSAFALGTVQPLRAARAPSRPCAKGSRPTSRPQVRGSVRSLLPAQPALPHRRQAIGPLPPSAPTCAASFPANPCSSPCAQLAHQPGPAEAGRLCWALGGAILNSHRNAMMAGGIIQHGSGRLAVLRKQSSQPSRHPSSSLPTPLQRAMSLLIFMIYTLRSSDQSQLVARATQLGLF